MNANINMQSYAEPNAQGAVMEIVELKRGELTQTLEFYQLKVK